MPPISLTFYLILNSENRKLGSKIEKVEMEQLHYDDPLSYLANTILKIHLAMSALYVVRFEPFEFGMHYDRRKVEFTVKVRFASLQG